MPWLPTLALLLVATVAALAAFIIPLLHGIADLRWRPNPVSALYVGLLTPPVALLSGLFWPLPVGDSGWLSRCLTVSLCLLAGAATTAILGVSIRLTEDRGVLDIVRVGSSNGGLATEGRRPGKTNRYRRCWLVAVLLPILMLAGWFAMLAAGSGPGWGPRVLGLSAVLASLNLAGVSWAHRAGRQALDEELSRLFELADDALDYPLPER